MQFFADGGRGEDFQFLTVPEELLIEIITRHKIHLKVRPFIRPFYLALRLMDRQRTHIVRLRAIDTNTDSNRLLVVGVIDTETAFEIVGNGDIGGRLHFVFRKGYVLHALQCKDRLSVVVIVRLRHQIPTAFPCAQEIRDSGKVFLGLFVERMLFSGILGEFDSFCWERFNVRLCGRFWHFRRDRC